MTGIVVWVFFLIQLYRIAHNVTANESFKRDDLYEEATLDGETSGRKMFRFLFKRLTRPKKSFPSRQQLRHQQKALDSSWGGLFSPDTIMNTEESFSVDDVKYNPYDLGSFWKNLLDALQRGPIAPPTAVAKKTN
jgi:hypothetical protein